MPSMILCICPMPPGVLPRLLCFQADLGVCLLGCVLPSMFFCCVCVLALVLGAGCRHWQGFGMATLGIVGACLYDGLQCTGTWANVQAQGRVVFWCPVLEGYS